MSTTTHGTPKQGAECMASGEDITNENYCEYLTAPSQTWHPSLYSEEIVRQLIATQFGTYLKNVENATRDCAAAVRRVIAKGPPTYLSDPHALPLPEGDTHITTIWYSKSNTEESARLEGALSEEEREKLWSDQKEVLASMEKVEASEATEAK
eukprot:c21247_g1_i2.p1 GENE.c21247_g1_i2~~c21247_g1_i2.p1  ORF type:complete len:153 (+),score=86.49 c21247_g1_i2:184-642(+)